MKKAAKTRSHTYLHTYTHIHSYTYTHTHTHNCSAALRHFDWSSTRCVLKILLCNYPLPRTRLPPLTCHCYLTPPPPYPLLPLFHLLLAALPFRCLFAYCAKISLEPTICSLLFFRSGCSPRGGGGTLQANEACYTTTYIPFIYALHGTETDSTGARHALPLRSHFVAIR